jgi:hypothetical protein
VQRSESVIGREWHTHQTFHLAIVDVMSFGLQDTHTRSTQYGSMTRDPQTSVIRFCSQLLACRCTAIAFPLLSIHTPCFALHCIPLHYIERTMRLSLSILRLTAALTSLTSIANASCWHSWDETYPCRDLLAMRGGATTLIAAAASTAAHSVEECPMELNDVSLSLRYTCEMNRRLNAAVQRSASIHDSEPEAPTNRSVHHHNPAVSMQRGGQMVHVHPSQQWEPPIRMASDDCDDVVTLFHAKEPRETRTGVKRWGQTCYCICNT